MSSAALRIYETYVRPLPPEERAELVELATRDLRAAAPGSRPKKNKLSELKGLGAELWQGIDPDRYVNELRDEWDLPRTK